MGGVGDDVGDCGRAAWRDLVSRWWSFGLVDAAVVSDDGVGHVEVVAFVTTGEADLAGEMDLVDDAGRLLRSVIWLAGLEFKLALGELLVQLVLGVEDLRLSEVEREGVPGGVDLVEREVSDPNLRVVYH